MPLRDRPVRGGHLDPVIIANREGDEPIPVDISAGVSVDSPPYVALGATHDKDAFGRVRVSNPVSLFDTQNQYDNSPVFWETVVTDVSGSAASAHVAASAAVRMTVGSADSVVRQSRQYFRYQPGKSQRIEMTFFAGWAANASIVQRSNTSGSVVNTSVAQASWNRDVLNGSGKSAVNMNWTKAQIFFIDLEWLGVGQVRTGFIVRGVVREAHHFENANNKSGVYMRTANLPLRYEVSESGGTVTARIGYFDANNGVFLELTGALSGTNTFDQICSAVTSEGGVDVRQGIPFSASNGTSLIAVTTRRPILSIRPRSVFNSIANRGEISVDTIEIYAQDQDTYWELVWGGTLSSASFSSVDATHSIVEYDVSASGITGGIVIDRGFASTGPGRSAGVGVGGLLSKLPLSLDIAGSHPTSPFTDSVSLVATSVPGTETDTSGVIRWKEIR